MKYPHQQTRAYSAWVNMKTRCNNPNYVLWARYGGRGITYAPEWESYSKFVEDMGQPDEGQSLDRIDNNGNYCKENCRWADARTQAHNRNLFAKNKTKITGVGWHKTQHKWQANVRIDYILFTLYWGDDFFEACCARKSWEAKNTQRKL